MALAFVLVPQPTFGQRAQTKLLRLREISFWEGACNTRPFPPQPNGFRFCLIPQKVPGLSAFVPVWYSRRHLASQATAANPLGAMAFTGG